MPSPPRFIRFNDLDADGIRVEWQVHTTQTDGENEIGEILAEAQRVGLRSVAFTEHVRRDTDWFRGFVSEVRRAASKYPDLEVLVGCEAKALNAHGGLDATDAILEECDLVLGSVHRLPDGQGGFLRFEDLTARELAEHEFRLSLGLVRGAPIHVLAHPGGMYQRRWGAFPPDPFLQIVQAVRDKDVAIEINSSYLVDAPVFLEILRAVDPFVSIGSDVHRLEDLGRCWRMLTAAGIGQP